MSSIWSLRSALPSKVAPVEGEKETCVTDPGSETPEEAQQPGLPAEPAAAGGAGAEVGVRALARIIDHVILAVVMTVVLVPLLFSGMAFGGAFGFGGFSGVGLLYGVVAAVITIGYFALMESNVGQTVGKMALGLKTEGPDGAKPTLEQAIRRNAWYALGIVPVLGGLAQLGVAIFILVTISNSATNTGWHDEFAGGTRVVKKS